MITAWEASGQSRLTNEFDVLKLLGKGGFGDVIKVIIDQHSDWHYKFKKKNGKSLIPKGPIKTAADDIHKYFFIFFSEKIRLDVSSESSARQRIHMKSQALFSWKDKSKILKCQLMQFLFGALKVNLQTVSMKMRQLIVSSFILIYTVYHLSL